MEKNRNIVLAFYAVMSVTVVLCSLPVIALLNLSLIVAVLTLIVAYLARARFPKNDSFEENHTTYVIRSLWLYSLLFLIGAIAASYFVFAQGNRESLAPMLEVIAAGQKPTESEMQSWTHQYAEDNAELLMRMFRLWLCPAQIYLVWRILQGGSRAFKGYRIARPGSWL
jgi:uncharacterized membrane protein